MQARGCQERREYSAAGGRGGRYMGGRGTRDGPSRLAMKGGAPRQGCDCSAATKWVGLCRSIACWPVVVQGASKGDSSSRRMSRPPERPAPQPAMKQSISLTGRLMTWLLICSNGTAGWADGSGGADEPAAGGVAAGGRVNCSSAKPTCRQAGTGQASGQASGPPHQRRRATCRAGAAAPPCPPPPPRPAARL